MVGASRAAADEIALAVASQHGGLFGVTRMGYAELATKLALPALAARGLSPTGGFGAEAFAARAAFEASAKGRLIYFAPVGSLPGFPRALARTLAELRLGGVSPRDLVTLGEAGRDLGELLTRVVEESNKAGAVDRAQVLATATEVLEGTGSGLEHSQIILLDVPVTTDADRRFVAALSRRARCVLATVPVGDESTLDSLRVVGFQQLPAVQSQRGDRTGALRRLQAHLFSRETLPPGELDESVVMFSAPGEGRECVEIARRVGEEAGRGVPFDQIAVVLRSPHSYLGFLEHAFQRAGIPSWFERGTRRPDPSGRAFLAVLACAEENLSARRFAEYLSLGQVPPGAEPVSDSWSAPTDEIAESVVPPDDRSTDSDPEDEARQAASEPERRGVVGGTLRAPWRWEELLVESAVMHGVDRWDRRLKGLREEYRMRLDELSSDEPESPRIPAIERDIEQLDHLREFALPVIQEMAEWPREPEWEWGQWLATLGALAPRVLRHPMRVLRVLQELGPLATVGPVSLREVREVLSTRLLTLTHDPPRRRQGRVFVGTPAAVRGRTFRVVFVPGLAERVFPQRLREDALLLDERRDQLKAPLPKQKQRADEERLQLRLAIGAASARAYLSWPRVELQESRQRVPSFYVLDVARAIEGRIPAYATVRDRAFAAGGATLAWPAPEHPERAIDEFEHDLSMLHGLLREDDHTRAKGRGRYLYELSPHLQRSLTGRWARWQRRWHPADGLIRTTPATAPALGQQRLGVRPFSLSALQRFADCPYQFHLSAIFRLAPLEEPAPLQRLDPLTRGSLFHQIQAEFFRELEKNGLLPITERPGRRSPEDARLGHCDGVEAGEGRSGAGDRPRLERRARVDRPRSASVARGARQRRRTVDARTLRVCVWFARRSQSRSALGRRTRPSSMADSTFAGRSISSSVAATETTLRITDHKTGKNRTTLATMVDGGRVLQPILYGMALEGVTQQRVEEGRLSFCTAVGGFSVHTIALDDVSRRRAIEVLEVIDRAIEQGTLAARPAEGACGRCDFIAVCGADEERRTRRKPAGLFADLDALRRIP